MIEMPRRSIGGKVFTIVCDEEGLLKSDPKIACISASDIRNVIVGNVMFVNDTDDGDIDSLTDDDIDLIRNSVLVTPDYNKLIVMD